MNYQSEGGISMHLGVGGSVWCLRGRVGIGYHGSRALKDREGQLKRTLCQVEESSLDTEGDRGSTGGF